MAKQVIAYNSYLSHHGIKGMRWGVRRYQNYDGSRIRLKDRDTKELRETTNRMKLEKEYTDSKSAPAKEIARNTRDAAYSAKNTSRTIESFRSRSKKAQREREAREAAVKEKLKGMSDDELRTTINRIRMEREYSSLTTREMRSGWDTTRDVLDIVGGVASIAIAGAGIMGVLPLIHDDTTDSLQHHGVKGMRWGVRKESDFSNRHLKAASASRKEAADLKRHGYTKEADSVLKVAQKQQAKGELKLRKTLAKTKANKTRLKNTKKDYKQAKKEWDKDFNAAYRSSSGIKLTKKGRQKRDQRVAKAAVSLGKMQIAKGKYMQAKGVYKANDKMVVKGKKLVEISKNSNPYFKALYRDVNSGYSIKQAQKRHVTEADIVSKRELEIEKKYK